MKTLSAVSLAVLISTGSVGPALAQAQVSPDYQQQMDQYQQQRNAYENQQQRYQDQRRTYENQRGDYKSRKRAYDFQLRAWREAARDYDAEYGAGSYEAIYPQPMFEGYAGPPDERGPYRPDEGGPYPRR